MATRRKQNYLVPVAIIALIVFGTLYYAAQKISEEDKVLAPEVALIEINGEIGADYSEELAKLIKKADKDKEIKAIIFEINSPGGTVLASKEIANAIKETKKPTVTLILQVHTL